VEDSGKRQLPGNVRAADPWTVAIAGLPGACEGWGMAGYQQAVADWRVDRAQPTHRASGVSCTAWFGGSTDLQFYKVVLQCNSTLGNRFSLIIPLLAPATRALPHQEAVQHVRNQQLGWTSISDSLIRTLLLK